MTWEGSGPRRTKRGMSRARLLNCVVSIFVSTGIGEPSGPVAAKSATFSTSVVANPRISRRLDGVPWISIVIARWSSLPAAPAGAMVKAIPGDDPQPADRLIARAPAPDINKDTQFRRGNTPPTRVPLVCKAGVARDAVIHRGAAACQPGSDAPGVCLGPVAC